MQRPVHGAESGQAHCRLIPSEPVFLTSRRFSNAFAFCLQRDAEPVLSSDPLRHEMLCACLCKSQSILPLADRFYDLFLRLIVLSPELFERRFLIFAVEPKLNADRGGKRPTISTYLRLRKRATFITQHNSHRYLTHRLPRISRCCRTNAP